MVKKTLVGLIIALALVAPIAGAPTAHASSATSVTGKWRGPVKLADGSSAGIRITVRIWLEDGVLKGREWRDDGRCTGRLAFKGWRDGWATFRQTITSGDCTPKYAPVKMQRRGERLFVRWFNPETGDSAYMLAWRIS